MPEPRVSLRNTSEILGWAQQLMDDGLPRSATELVRLAIEEDPEQRPLWRFLIACAFEDGNVTEFADLAQAFVTQFPNDAEIEEIRSMERQLARQPVSASASGSYIPPTRKHSSSILGRDDSVQLAFHAALTQAAAAQQPR